MKVLLAHVRYRSLEYARQPFAIIPTLAFPLMITAFFILPNLADGFQPANALAIVLLLTFTMIAMFNFGAGTAEERRLPWDGYLRTLPLRPRTALAGRIVVGLGFALVGAAPAVALIAIQTALDFPLQRVPVFAAGVLLGAVAMTGLGLTLGNALPYKAAIATANILFLPMAFVGGLFLPVEILPEWAATAGLATPVRPWVEVAIPSATGEPVAFGWWGALAGWAVFLCALAAVAYRRDQVQRFR
jgi:ABC-2 type transport system permease protein